jgi:hypothetical protein
MQSSIIYEPQNYHNAYPEIDGSQKSKLGYHTNNQYDGFPPLMSDGRAITASYQPEAVLNNYLLKETGVTSNWEYRRYLTNQAKDIMKYNCIQSANDAGYYRRYINDNGTTENPYSTPYIFPSYVDTSKPVGYQTSDLKEIYLSREQLQARMVAPEITQEQLQRQRQNMYHS